MYTCSDGYQQSGMISRTCESSEQGGRWSGSSDSEFHCTGTNLDLTFSLGTHLCVCSHL